MDDLGISKVYFGGRAKDYHIDMHVRNDCNLQLMSSRANEYSETTLPRSLFNLRAGAFFILVWKFVAVLVITDCLMPA